MKGVLLIAVVVAFTTPVCADGPTNGELADMMAHTKMVAVTWDKPANAFVHDNDPDTLEVVLLSGPNAGPSHVSDDGEAIFLSNDASQDEMQALTTQAFAIRWQRRRASP